ncbi:hypothetical protein STEG23_003203 [Scotinomys teguina]
MKMCMAKDIIIQTKRFAMQMQLIYLNYVNKDTEIYTLHLIEEKVGSTLEHIGTGDQFLNIIPTAQTIITDAILEVTATSQCLIINVTTLNLHMRGEEKVSDPLKLEMQTTANHVDNCYFYGYSLEMKMIASEELGLGSSVVECFSSVAKTLGSVPSTTKKNIKIHSYEMFIQIISYSVDPSTFDIHSHLIAHDKIEEQRQNT